MQRGPSACKKGRGATGNPQSRFDPHERTAVDDGWWQDDDLPPLRTTVGDEAARQIITRNTSTDIPFDRSINPYQGCEHGCIYCYARPSHGYLGLSAGLDFETRLFAKPNAAALLVEELQRPDYRPATIMLGANTDPYQPIERQRRITRAVIEVLAACRHPMAITTKSALVCRDLDLLTEMAGDGLVAVGVSLTTLDPGLARIMEPRATAPAGRLRTIETLARAGVPVRVMAAPMIPFINDHELEHILEAGAGAGADGASWTLVRLPHELKQLFRDWLAAHYPERCARVEAAIRDSRGGRLYDSDWQRRMRGQGPYAEMLASRFDISCRRLGLAHGAAGMRPLVTGLFRPPPDAEAQFSFDFRG
ncbi:MAG: PA0069 family radical SAM protein [Rhodospirillales bacterium]